MFILTRIFYSTNLQLTRSQRHRTTHIVKYPIHWLAILQTPVSFRTIFRFAKTWLSQTNRIIPILYSPSLNNDAFPARRRRRQRPPRLLCCVLHPADGVRFCPAGACYSSIEACRIGSSDCLEQIPSRGAGKWPDPERGGRQWPQFASRWGRSVFVNYGGDLWLIRFNFGQ